MINLFDVICNFVLLFFVFSFLGWCTEVTLKYIQFHRFINRGFLIGPYCPIYGTGAVLVTIAVGGISNFESSYGMTFVISFFVCGAIEYIASYYMEKKYHARWWDYSQKPMNLNGRIWIGNLILFGIGGTVIVKIMDPFFFGLFGHMTEIARHTCTVVLVAIFMTDSVVSRLIMKLIKVSVENSEADNTEAVSKEVRMLLSNKSVLHQRIVNAYPDVIYKTERISKKLEEVRLETEQLRAKAEKKKNELAEFIVEEKENLASVLEGSGAVKSDIIKMQDELIQLLEMNEKDKVQIAELKNEIEKKKVKAKFE
ncbi:MAG: hypothetical protein PHE06_15145 [Lachnospiraceae bacterium]|nr:hypothetical protein [Lachnospiraceae bacterium]